MGGIGLFPVALSGTAKAFSARLLKGEAAYQSRRSQRVLHARGEVVGVRVRREVAHVAAREHVAQRALRVDDGQRSQAALAIQERYRGLLGRRARRRVRLHGSQHLPLVAVQLRPLISL